MTGMMIAVVHNHEESIPAKRVAMEIQKIDNNISCFEFSDQHLDNSLGLDSLMSFAINQSRIERLWRRYRGRASLFQDILSARDTLFSITKLALSKKSFLKAQRVRQIELAVNQKHLKSWQSFLESNSTFILVLEADATWLPRQKRSLEKILKSLSQESPFFLDIGGGFDLHELGVEGIEAQREHSKRGVVVSFVKPVTNTACAYIMNRPMVRALLESSQSSGTRDWKGLGIDWFMNGLFMDINKRGLKVTCKHFSPPLLCHGSMSGITDSWHPDRQ